MKPVLTFLSIVLISLGAAAQTFKEKELKTKLNEVTVFLEGAQLFESATTSVPVDKSVFRIKDLSPFIDEKSIQVKADGNFIILSVNHRYNYLDLKKKDHSLDSLTKLYQSLEDKILLENARLEVLHEKESLLDENKALGGTNAGVTIPQLRQAMELFDTELMRIKDEEIRINRSVAIKKEEQLKLSKQLREQNDRKILPTSEIEIRVSAEQSVQGKFYISYLVSNAGWFPKYDIRVKNINSPLGLTYKAEVFQNTGVDWKNVKLRFSNGMPNQSGLIPELQPWLMNFARYTHVSDKSSLIDRNIGTVKGRVTDDNGEPLPGVNVLVKGTTIGTVTDGGGAYSLTLPRQDATLVFSFIGYTSQETSVTGADMNIQLATDASALQEVVVTAYGVGSDGGYDDKLSGKVSGVRIRGANTIKYKSMPITTRFIENQTTVEIEVKEPYSIKSDGEKLMVDLMKYEIPAQYEYYAVPKLDKDAFLIARIVHWDQYNLLEGEANLYFEDAYIGRSILTAKALTDTLSISLGRDKNIVIARTKVDQYTRTRTIGANKTEIRGFRIVVKNKKSQVVKLTLFDQLPVSVNSNITVTPVNLSGAKVAPESGKLTWEHILEPQQQKEFLLQYEIKYPRRESILLE